jgi:glycosyltransferase involved in cell wall biosynthesis
MKFSIIVPIYKVEEYLERCVKSLIEQTEKNIEIILVDDGSPDSCPKMCDEFAKCDSRIKVIHKENGGLSDARNAGLNVATGEYVLFVDSDDYISLDACERFYKIIDQNKGVDIISANGITSDGTVFVKESSLISEAQQNARDYFKLALKHGFFRTEAWLNFFRRDFLEKHNLRFKLGFLHEDAEFTPRAYMLASTVAHSNEISYYYTINPNSIMHKKDFQKNCWCIYEIAKEHAQSYAKTEDKTLYKYLMDFMLVQYLSIFNIGYCSKYGKKYVHKKFALKHAYKFRTRLHALVFAFSAKLYNYLINKEGRKNGTKNS